MSRAGLAGVQKQTRVAGRTWIALCSCNAANVSVCSLNKFFKTRGELLQDGLGALCVGQCEEPRMSDDLIAHFHLERLYEFSQSSLAPINYLKGVAGDTILRRYEASRTFRECNVCYNSMPTLSLNRAGALAQTWRLWQACSQPWIDRTSSLSELKSSGMRSPCSPGSLRCPRYMHPPCLDVVSRLTGTTDGLRSHW